MTVCSTNKLHSELNFVPSNFNLLAGTQGITVMCAPYVTQLEAGQHNYTGIGG